ncbi:MAG: hypothetical protein QNJ07_16145, partial [Woeseiaceae bacterium]|nr:hypothetical protein [Woeseiaceae bacterium]
MKSPLVDALRKANESTKSGDDTDTVLVDSLPHDATLTANEDYPLEALESGEEFELLDSDDPPPVDSADQDDLPDLEAEADEDVEAPHIELSTSRALTATQALRQTSLAVEAPPMPLSRQQTMTRVMKLGRYSPLVCGALGAAAAGIYLAWLSFGGAYENSDLRALPSQVNSVDSEIAKFEAGASPFRLIVDEPAADADRSVAE